MPARRSAPHTATIGRLKPAARAGTRAGPYRINVNDSGSSSIYRHVARLRHAVPAVLALLVAVAPMHGSAASPNLPDRLYVSAPTTRPMVALTFDDGPSAYTPQILVILRRFHAHATFFVVGIHVAPNAATVRAEVAGGDLLGNHTYTHIAPTWVTDSTLRAQIGSTQAAIHAAGGPMPHWFRPPYGAFDEHVIALAASIGLRTILWSVDPADWSRPGTSAIIVRVLAAAHAGSVILLHDGGGDRSETVAALPYILATLHSRGYQFVTLDTLFAVSVARPQPRPRTAHQAHRLVPPAPDHPAALDHPVASDHPTRSNSR